MSNSIAQGRAIKKRDYKMDARARKQAETRLRIVEAAVDLHSTLGPAQTSLSQIAERAGVQRHTLYAHFPDERSLGMACSGLTLERDPLPDPEPWAALPPGPERLHAGLEAIYAWYARNAQMAGCVLRDAEHHELTQEIIALRFAPVFARAAALLGGGLSPDGAALLAVAFEFHCWRTLSVTHDPRAAARIMTRAILGASH